MSFLIGILIGFTVGYIAIRIIGVEKTVLFVDDVIDYFKALFGGDIKQKPKNDDKIKCNPYHHYESYIHPKTWHNIYDHVKTHQTIDLEILGDVSKIRNELQYFLGQEGNIRIHANWNGLHGQASIQYAHYYKLPTIYEEDAFEYARKLIALQNIVCEEDDKWKAKLSAIDAQMHKAT